MRIVVTGASGFLGRATVACLQNRGFSVLGVTRRAQTNGSVVVTDYAQTPGGDVLVHLAEPSDRSAASLLGDRHVSQVKEGLRALLDGRFEHIIYASSASLYMSADIPLQVGAAVHTIEPYDVGKLACELLALRAGGIVLRFSNLYGRVQKSGTVLGAILSQIPGSGPLIIQDTIPVRDFLWVEDAADAIASVANLQGPMILNVGSGRGLSIGELARMTLDMSGQAARPIMATRQSVGSNKVILDISDTINRTNWRPRIDIKEGLQRALENLPTTSR